MENAFSSTFLAVLHLIGQVQKTAYKKFLVQCDAKNL